jgi:AcrR family transcriptional regulator
MGNQTELRVVDGRRQRSERSRAAILTAALNLIDRGNYAPTTREIAQEAGVGLRSFFRHFEDMEALIEAIDQKMRQYYEPLFDRDFQAGELEARIEDTVIGLTDAYERLKNMMMITRVQLWRSEVLQKNYARNQNGLRKHLEKWLPELKGVPEANREAAHATASYETWDRLRRHQKLNISQARNAMIAALTAVL